MPVCVRRVRCVRVVEGQGCSRRSPPEEVAGNRREQLVSMETADKNSGTLCYERRRKAG